MRQYLTATFLAAVIAGCADLSTQAERSPAELVLTPGVATVTAGTQVGFDVSVVDSDGRPLDRIPDWASAQWASTNSGVVAADENGLRAVAPGQAEVSLTLAGLRRNATVRVNPSSVKLTIADVRLTQPGSSTTYLRPGLDTRVDVFLTVDSPNFFQPKVRATLMEGDRAIFSTELVRSGVSIPEVMVLEAGNAWSGTIPAAHLRSGVSIVVDADTERALPHVAGSQQRYPSVGAFAIAIGEKALRLRIDGAHLTQSVQTFDNSIPLVQGRDALLRVFLTADEENEYSAGVRVTFHRNGSIVHQVNLTRSQPAIPLGAVEGVLSNSYNALIPGSVLQAGVSYVIEADPQGLIPSKPGSVRRLPETGSMALDVRPVPKLWVRMVPITQSNRNTTGDITTSNLQKYVNTARAMFPVDQYDVDIRTPLVTTTTASNFDGWLQILREVQALRIADGSGRYYYGVLRHPGGNNIGGLGYLGYPAAVGYDHPEYGPETFAHELGHNFNLSHAPCGGPADADPRFPHAGGGIGVFGYDLFTQTLKAPDTDKDLMTYCGPEWISDYHYLRTLNFRNQFDWGKGANVAARREDALLVWGGVGPEGLVLEPAVELPMVASVPSGTGPYEVRGVDASGTVLFSYRFSPGEVDHIDARSFAFAIPTRVARPDQLAEIVLTGPEGRASRSRSPVSGNRVPGPSLNRLPGGPRVSWAATEFPLAVVRDAQTGEVLSFARGGQVTVPGRLMDIFFSDGVRTERQRIDAR
jgi:hypothetical protein